MHIAFKRYLLQIYRIALRSILHVYNCAAYELLWNDVTISTHTRMSRKSKSIILYTEFNIKCINSCLSFIYI